LAMQHPPCASSDLPLVGWNSVGADLEVMGTFNSTFNTRFGTKTTSDLTEGSNQYFTAARALSAFSAGTGISIAGGVISNTATATTWSNTITTFSAGAKTAGTAYQPSTTKKCRVSLGASVTNQIAVIGSAVGTVFFEIASPSAPSTWITVCPIAYNSTSLLGLTTGNGSGFAYELEAGYSYRFRLVSTISGLTNTVTAGYLGGSEQLSN